MQRAWMEQAGARGGRNQAPTWAPWVTIPRSRPGPWRRTQTTVAGDRLLVARVDWSGGRARGGGPGTHVGAGGDDSAESSWRGHASPCTDDHRWRRLPLVARAAWNGGRGPEVAEPGTHVGAGGEPSGPPPVPRSRVERTRRLVVKLRQEPGYDAQADQVQARAAQRPRFGHRKSMRTACDLRTSAGAAASSRSSQSSASSPRSPEED